MLPNKPHHRRADCRALLAWFSGALAFIVAGSGCQMMSHTQNSDGVRMFQQAYYQGALQSFQQAIQSDPKNPDGYYNSLAPITSWANCTTSPPICNRPRAITISASTATPTSKIATEAWPCC